ncbi:MAG: DMT family transporter [Nitrososphaerales archaeon]|nr:DMT family transporter [Nitrososphaerales archaeon]
MGSINSRILGYVYVITAAIIWGSNGVFVNWIPLSPYVIAFFRVLFASLSLLPIVLMTQRREVFEAIHSWKILLTLGLMLSLGWGLLFQSMKLISIASAVFLNYIAPIFATFFASVFLGEKVEKVTIIALMLSIIGILMISFPQTDHGGLNLLGVLSGLFAGLAYAIFIILSKKAMMKLSSRIVAFYSYLSTIFFLSPFLINANLSLELNSWLLLLVLGFFNTGFAVTLYLNGLNLIKVQRAVILTYLEPVSAIFFGFFFLAQQPTLSTIIGGLLIIVASYLSTSK